MTAHPLDEPGPTAPAAPPRAPGWRRPAGLVALVLAVVALAPVVVVQAVGQAHLRTADDVAAADVVLVPGAGLRPDGTPSLYLERRLEAARTLLADGTVEVALVSGDNRSASYDEPTAMRDWLLAHGVEEGRVVLDFAGLDTHDTCVRAREIFGVERAVVVSQDYHVRRAVFSCRAAGIDVQGVGVASTGTTAVEGVWYRLREAAASWKGAVDALLGREPAHLGDPEPGVRDVLDR